MTTLKDLLNKDWEQVDVVAGYLILKKGEKRIIYDTVKEITLSTYDFKPQFKPKPEWNEWDGKRINPIIKDGWSGYK